MWVIVILLLLALFTATMVGLAISLVVPGLPLAILVMCPAAGVITLLLRAPLTAILLVSVLVGAGGGGPSFFSEVGGRTRACH